MRLSYTFLRCPRKTKRGWAACVTVRVMYLPNVPPGPGERTGGEKRCAFKALDVIGLGGHYRPCTLHSNWFARLRAKAQPRPNNSWSRLSAALGRFQLLDSTR